MRAVVEPSIGHLLGLQAGGRGYHRSHSAVTDIGHDLRPHRSALAEIHASPQWLWRSLVSRLVSFRSMNSPTWAVPTSSSDTVPPSGQPVPVSWAISVGTQGRDVRWRDRRRA